MPLILTSERLGIEVYKGCLEHDDASEYRVALPASSP